MKNNRLSSRKSSIWTVLMLVLIATFVLGACNRPSLLQPSPTVDPVEKAMQTLQVKATQEYYQTQMSKPSATPTTVYIPPTNTVVQPTQIPTMAPATAVPTMVVQPSPIVIQPTAAPVQPTNRPQPTATPVPCNQVAFVSDVTVPDGSKIAAGTVFTKTWRLKNSGSCTWATTYDYAYVNGTLMSNKIFDLPKEVRPGETIDISVEMTAPAAEGAYASEFMMVNTNGVRFGTGADGKGSFWVKIQVTSGKGAIYNFATNAKQARWSSSTTNPLPFPGVETSITNGYVLTKNNPIREDGGVENEIGLITRPNNAANGYLQGVYPAIEIKKGDLFMSAIQCEGNSPKCNIKFEIYYQVPGVKATSLGVWYEVADNKWNPLKIDLSSLAGQKVVFYLVVWNNGATDDNRGLWLNPVIYRP